MPRTLIPVLTAAFLASIGVMYAAATNGSVLSFGGAAAAFAATAALAALRLSAFEASPANHAPDAQRAILASSTLVAVIYLWGGIALFAIYPLAGLTWRHGWQYGLAMLLAASGLFVYVRLMAKRGECPSSRASLDAAAMLAAVHAVAITAGLAYIVVSGKLSSAKDDWAAHWIFVTGGVALLVVSVIEVATHLRLRKQMAT